MLCGQAEMQIYSIDIWSDSPCGQSAYCGQSIIKLTFPISLLLLDYQKPQISHLPKCSAGWFLVNEQCILKKNKKKQWRGHDAVITTVCSYCLFTPCLKTKRVLSKFMIQMTTISFTCEWKVMTHHAVKLDEPSQLLLIIYTAASIIFDPWGEVKRTTQMLCYTFAQGSL